MTSESLNTAASRARVQARLAELADAAHRTSTTLAAAIAIAAELVRETLDRGGTIFFCGNGGSAADAQHMATEYVVRYMRNRRSLRAIALTTDTSLLTAAGNDFGFDEIFSRQIEGLARSGDLLMVHSTSGNSPNVLRAARKAREMRVTVVSLSARSGGELVECSDLAIVIPTDRTDVAQELHLCVQHMICELVEATIT